MDQPPPVRDTDTAHQDALMRANPIALPATNVPSGLLASGMPFVLGAGVGPEAAAMAALVAERSEAP